uniref:Uncharacterized protein n=1 Tax=Picea sitchensis TaxID=3332 RepID=A9P2J3_PICSI|nr:unknown [Picea sitchensis]
MAKWLRVLALGGGAGTTTWLASAGCLLLAVTCVLAVVAVVTASCAAHFHRRNAKNRGTTGFKFAHKLPGRALINSSKKFLISKKWRRNEEEEAAYDRAAMEEQEGGGDSVWQRSILMGERCQPPAFSGLIIYDDKGNRLPQFPPRSPILNIFHPSLDQR